LDIVDTGSPAFVGFVTFDRITALLDLLHWVCYLSFHTLLDFLFFSWMRGVLHMKDGLILAPQYPDKSIIILSLRPKALADASDPRGKY
jgi:hypothetical protein